MSAAICIPIDPLAPNPAAIARAAEVIRAGGLVAFPTETVYGLGANALDPAAVQRIFAAKGRPPTNPVIVHAASGDDARQLASQWTPAADRLAQRFWPGPLSLVLPRAAAIPDIVAAGGPTVALRVPALPLTQRLIQAAGVPIAAPSANLSTQLSATTAQHVQQSLGDRVQLILDGGFAPGGLESTVVDATCTPPRVLRPGLLDLPTLAAAWGGPVEIAAAVVAEDHAARSPGLQRRHYAPSVPLECTTDDGLRRAAQLLAAGHCVGWIPLAGAPPLADPRLIARPLPNDPALYARLLYATLHELQSIPVDHIVLQLPPLTEPWRAILDRLTRASA